MIDSALSSSPSLQSPPGVCNRVNIDFCRVHLCNQRNQPKLSNRLKIHVDPRVHLCNQVVIGLFVNRSAPVADRLKHPVSFGFLWIFVSVNFPVTAVISSPFLVAEFLRGPVVRIGFHLDSLPIGFSCFLAFGPAAAILLSISWDKHRRAMETRHRLNSSSPGWMSFLNKRIRGTIWNFTRSGELKVDW